MLAKARQLVEPLTIIGKQKQKKKALQKAEKRVEPTDESLQNSHTCGGKSPKRNVGETSSEGFKSVKSMVAAFEARAPKSDGLFRPEPSEVTIPAETAKESLQEEAPLESPVPAVHEEQASSNATEELAETRPAATEEDAPLEPIAISESEVDPSVLAGPDEAAVPEIAAATQNPIISTDSMESLTVAPLDLKSVETPRSGFIAPESERSSSESEHAVSTSAFQHSMKSGKANILVAVRARPLNEREEATGAKEVLKVLDGKVVVLTEHMLQQNDFLRHGRSRDKSYAFDHAFDETCGQREVYNQTTKFLIEGITNGFNASVFAYGATGSGKTYTMVGTLSQPGIMSLALEDLFTYINQQQDAKFKVHLSFVEVYNENLRDLLNPSSAHLSLREDPLKGVQVAGVTELVAQSAEDVMELLDVGNRNRTTEPTEANQTSSRSHAILQVVVEQKDKTADKVESIRIGKLSLIDLAGSERASITKNRGIRMIEGANINRSLLALGNCINALGANSNFVPFRDSKLTRMLKDSLGGNTRTVMITTVSKADNCVEDTHNTLKYANRAKYIKTKVKRNVLEVSHHLSQYTEIISELRREVSDLKRRLRQRNDRKSVPHQHWLSASAMASWNETRRKSQAIFIERKRLGQKLSDLRLKSLSSSQIASSSDVENQAETMKGSSEGLLLLQNEEEIQKCGKSILAKEQKLRDEVGMAAVSASQPVSQILELELDRHDLRVQNHQLHMLRDMQAHSRSLEQHKIKELHEQIRLRDEVLKEQDRMLTENSVLPPLQNVRSEIHPLESLMKDASPLATSFSDIDMASRSLILPAVNVGKNSRSSKGEASRSDMGSRPLIPRAPTKKSSRHSNRPLPQAITNAYVQSEPARLPKKPAALFRSVMRSSISRIRKKAAKGDGNDAKKISGTTHPIKDSKLRRKLRKPSNRFGFASAIPSPSSSSPTHMTPGRGGHPSPMPHNRRSRIHDARNNKQDSVIRNRRDSTRGTVKSTSKSPNPHRNQSHHERHPDKSEKGETERDSEEVHLELIEDRVENLEQKVSSCPDRDERSDRGLSRV